MMDGKPIYVRDGQVFEHGMLGDGLVQAVSGNAAATIAANQYHDHMRDGLLEVLLGTAAEVGGTAWFAYDAASSADAAHPRINAVPLVIAAAGVAVMIYGAVDLASAEPYRWDAINLFNDGAQLDRQQVVDQAHLAPRAGQRDGRVLAPPGLEGGSHPGFTEVIAK
jgi:hypothetical protein